MSSGVLYISYDGMLEALGLSQVLCYLERLSPGRSIHLISFEKAKDWANSDQRELVQSRMKKAGIRWHPLPYHKSPSAVATGYDIVAGSLTAIALCVRHRLNLIHARSYVAGLMALNARRASRAKFLFDMRGLWADERVDGGLWRAGGRLYHTAKNLERRLLLAADHVVTLTHASVEEISSFPHLEGRALCIDVIPTCADLERFTIQTRHSGAPFTLGYIGSVGTWYLLDEMLRTFEQLRKRISGARLLIANQREHELILARAAAHQLRREEIELIEAPHSEMPKIIARMNAAMAIIKPAYSKIASAPTKLAEYLGCGVPCLGNSGVGDVADVLEGQRVGVALSNFSDEEISTGVDRLIGLTKEADIQQRCRNTALALYSLESGIAAYERIYTELGS